MGFVGSAIICARVLANTFAVVVVLVDVNDDLWTSGHFARSLFAVWLDSKASAYFQVSQVLQVTYITVRVCI